jgi:DNA-binding transcriptional regulator YdaS (Cro superfamily)
MAVIRNQARSGSAPNQHPKARKPPKTSEYKGWKQNAKHAKKHMPNLDSWRRKKFTRQELEWMYLALHELLTYYGGKKKLAAKDMGISPSTLNHWIKVGRVTVFGADIVGSNPQVPFSREQLRPDITKKGWQNFDKAAPRFYEKRNKQKKMKGGKYESNVRPTG